MEIESFSFFIFFFIALSSRRQESNSDLRLVRGLAYGAPPRHQLVLRSLIHCQKNSIHAYRSTAEQGEGGPLRLQGENQQRAAEEFYRATIMSVSVAGRMRRPVP